MKLRDLTYFISAFENVRLILYLDNLKNSYNSKVWTGLWKDCHYMNSELVSICGDEFGLCIEAIKGKKDE